VGKIITGIALVVKTWCSTDSDYEEVRNVRTVAVFWDATLCYKANKGLEEPEETRLQNLPEFWYLTTRRHIPEYSNFCGTSFLLSKRRWSLCVRRKIILKISALYFEMTHPRFVCSYRYLSQNHSHTTYKMGLSRRHVSAE
jgi:hypothetical protein